MQKVFMERTKRPIPYEAPSAQVIEFSLEGMVAQSGGTETFIPGVGFGEGDFI